VGRSTSCYPSLSVEATETGVVSHAGTVLIAAHRGEDRPDRRACAIDDVPRPRTQPPDRSG
jgi:hypothetical protein